MSDAQRSAVIKFYDTHPINEDEILAKIAARGISFDALTEDDLKDFGKRVLVERLEMYRPLRDTTIAKFGEGQPIGTMGR